jgi:hypothetical protein
MCGIVLRHVYIGSLHAGFGLTGESNIKHSYALETVSQFAVVFQSLDIKQCNLVSDFICYVSNVSTRE